MIAKIKSFFENMNLHSFLLRLFVVFLSIILCFNLLCKPKRVEAAASLGIMEIISIIGTLGSLAISSVGLGVNMYRAAKDDDTLTEDDMTEYFNQQITIDGDGNYIISDDGLATINAMKEAYEEEVTYQYGYFVPPEHVDVSYFQNKTAYTLFCNLIKNNPGKAFLFLQTTCEVVNYDSNGKQTDSNYMNALKVYCFDAPYAGVSASGKSITTSKVSMYEEDWTSDFDCICFHLVNAGENGFIQYVDSSGVYHRYDDLENPFDLSLVDLKSTETLSSFMGISSNYFESGVTPNNNYIFSSFAGAVPVFKTVSDMKKGTEAGTKGQFMPGYTPGAITDNSITQTEINDYSTNYNYYYGDSGSGGSGSGDSGNSSSGGFLDSLLSALGGLGDAVLGVLSKLIEFIAKAIKLVTDSFSDIVSLAENGFVDLLTAFFPFLPSEWILAITLVLALAVLGVVIKIFSK